jgi:hypothetical protein
MPQLKKFLQLLILIVTPFVLFAFCIGLYEKIKKPEFKNLPTSEYLLIGLMLFLMMISNINYLKNLSKKKISQ